ncbi:anti-sigma factor [Neolewinella aurantiaca]|uniref:anti-sigma factor n=1 Tax=Neolewinella aurantiaca TaxID=2602767 RepID=UPI00164F5F94|nr:anti-sigma factor [Neolewinella aurantiaca]
MPTDKLEDFILNNREHFDDENPPADLWSRIDDALNSGGDETDPLESFIATNRDAFDDVTPPPRLEGRIFASMDQAGATPMAPASEPAAPRLKAVRGRRQTLRLLGIAASFLVLIFAAFTIGSQQGYRTAEEEALATELRQISPELVETETYYRSEIAAQFTKVDMMNDDPQLRKDLAAIDAATNEIRANLLEVPVSQRAALVDKLIETYRTKLNILLRIQEHLPSSSAPASTTQQQNNEL